MKKFVVIILITVLCFNFIYREQKAEAFAPAAAYPYIASLLVGAGLVCTSEQSLKSVCEKFWNDATQDIRDNLMASVAVGELLYGGFWLTARGWLDTNIGDFEDGFQGGIPGADEIVLTSSYGLLVRESQVLNSNCDWIVSTTITDAALVSSQGIKYSVMIGGVESDYGIIESYSGVGIYKIRLPGDLGYWTSTGTNKQTFTFGLEREGSNIKYWINGEVMATVPIYGDVVYKLYQSVGQQTSTVYTQSFYNNIIETVDIPAGDVYASSELLNPNWDLENKKNIPYPNVSDYTGKTAQDLTYTNIDNPPNVGNETGTVTGWLSNVYSKLGTIATSIARFFDLSKPVDFNPLKTSGALFTTKFPFSLPWDIIRSFGSLTGSGFNPHIVFNIPANPLIGANTIDVDMSIWTDIVAVVRKLELLAFDIGLILITRKLLGGAV